MANHGLRRDRLWRAIQKAGVDGLLVTNFTNVTYLTGFTGDDSYLLVFGGKAILLSDPRYTTQIGEECDDLDFAIREPGVSMLSLVQKLLKQAKLLKLGVEADSMTVGLAQRIGEVLPGLELVPTAGLVETLRQQKDADEVNEIREAVWFAERALGVILAGLQPEMTEKEVADELEHQMRRFGAQGCSFPSIIASGERAALPHARPTDAVIGASDLLLIDWGASGRLYKSDLTRTFALTRIPPKLERVYRVVLTAQQQAIDAIRPGVTAEEVDRVARNVIHDAGFGKHFGHGLGHGLGLEVHESPRLAVNMPVVLKPGMVVTVEPGIYLPGWGGVRIEDDVLVTRGGCEVLTGFPKQLEDCSLV